MIIKFEISGKEFKYEEGKKDRIQALYGGPLRRPVLGRSHGGMGILRDGQRPGKHYAGLHSDH